MIINFKCLYDEIFDFHSPAKDTNKLTQLIKEKKIWDRISHDTDPLANEINIVAVPFMKNTGNIWPQIPKLWSFCGENRSDRPWGDILLTTVCERLSKASFQNIKSKRNPCFSTEDSIEGTEPKVDNKSNGKRCRPLALFFLFFKPNTLP